MTRIPPADLRALADEIEADDRIGRVARLVTASILRGLAARQAKGATS